MAEGFHYFTSEDAGAPELSNKPGRLIAVLDWLLVGKGGWTKEFTGTNLGSYRSVAGNRFFLRVDDTQATHSRLRGYRNMSAISTGTGAFPTTAQGTTASWGMSKTYNGSTVARRYKGIRTNRYVMMFVSTINYDDASYGAYHDQWQMMAFGDVPSECESDAFNSIIVGTASAEYGHPYFPNNYCFDSSTRHPLASIDSRINSDAALAVAGTPDGGVVSPASGLFPPWGILRPGGVEMSNISKSGRLHYAPFSIMSTTRLDGIGGMYPRARFPNLRMVWGAIYSQPHADSPCHYLEEFSANGHDFITLTDYNGPEYASWSLGFLLVKSDTDGAL